MNIESISAIQECMSDLGLHPNKAHKFTVDAIIEITGTNYNQGNLIVTFNSNVHSGEGPYIETGEEIMGFGIPHTIFKPRFQKFIYTSQSKTLLVSGNDYSFTLVFKK